MEFKTDLITYMGVYRTIETEKLNLPTSQGRRTILANHMAIMIPLDIGIIETEEQGVLKHYVTNGGVVYFKDNVAEVIADSIIDVEEINIEEELVEKAKQEEKLAKATRENERIRAKTTLEVVELRIETAKRIHNIN